MKIDIVTLFPEIFTPLQHSIPARIQKAGLATVQLHQLRQWTGGKHKQIDDTPYGGGPGMVMACQPWFDALRQLTSGESRPRILHLSPQGPPLTQSRVLELSRLPHLLLMCGHYEGIDERVIEHWVDEEICVGDFVVSGGELPAMMLVDAILRVLPGALKAGSAEQDSFYHGLLDHPHYTRPASFEGLEVPEVLLGGNHAAIEGWRHQQSLQRTRQRRPDLYARWQNDEEANKLAGKRKSDHTKGVSYGQETLCRGTREQEEEPPRSGQ